MNVWRNHANHKEETKAVKAALVKAGYTSAKVGHGTGTAWAWLEITLEVPMPKECRCAETSPRRCLYCQQLWREHHDKAIGIAKQVTGRHGDYHGDTSVTVNLV